MALCPAPGAAVADSQLSAADREATLRELEALRGRMRELQERLEAIRTEHAAMREDLRETERRIGSLVNSLKRLDEQTRAHRRELERLRGEQSEEQARLASHQSILGAQIRTAYATGRQEFLKLLLNQEDPAAVGRMMRYYDYLNRVRHEQIEQAREGLTRLAAVRERIESESAALNRAQAAQEREKTELEKTYAERERMVARLDREIELKGEELARMMENESRLEDLVEALNRLLADIPGVPDGHRPFAETRGELPWPTKGRVDSIFGAARGAGTLVWNGVRIRAEEGEDVRAVSHGRVAFADWLRGYGLLIIVDHGDGYMSLYGHNQSLHKETGDWVEAGELIARVGRSGGQSDSALYFEIRHNGKPTDPVRWCAPGA